MSEQPSGYSAHGLPPGLSIDPVTGVISGTPLGPVAHYNITVQWTGDDGLEALNRVRLDPGLEESGDAAIIAPDDLEAVHEDDGTPCGSAIVFFGGEPRCAAHRRVIRQQPKQ